MAQTDAMMAFRARRAAAIALALKAKRIFRTGTPQERRQMIERELRAAGVDTLLAVSASQAVI